MDELTSHFREAVAESPPSRIDLDGLIAADRQRRRHRAWTLTGTGVAAVVAVVAVPNLVAALGAGPARMNLPPMGSRSGDASLCAVPNPSASGPEPLRTYDPVLVRPTEQPEAGVRRLTTALRAALAATVPTNHTVTGTRPECEQPQFAYQTPNRGYETVATLTRDGLHSHLRVAVFPTPRDAQADCAGAPDGLHCEVQGLGDDGVAMFSTSTDPAGGICRWVEFQRADGTSVTVTVGNLLYRDSRPVDVPAPVALLTEQELFELARAPGLTLYP